MKKILIVLSLFLVHVSHAKLSLPAFFSDHMVLQADKALRVWGEASAGAQISVSLTGNPVETTADGDGKWSLHLPPMKASSEGFILTVSNGKEVLKIRDVLIGEVWFASGQSNMNWPMRKVDLDDTEISKAKFPGIRIFQAAKVASAKPQSDAEGEWKVCTPENVGEFSAVAYYFSKNLHRELNVPVGVIKSAWGGMPVESFTRSEALAMVPEGKKLLSNFSVKIEEYDEQVAKQRYKDRLIRYEQRLLQWKNTPEQDRKKRRPLKPFMAPRPEEHPSNPSTIWNGMIHPFVGYTIRGVIWYQGESNAGSTERAGDYGALFALKIKDWREQWGDDFRYLWVQLANFKKPVTEPGTNDSWAIVQEQQFRCLKLPKTGMAVANDIGAAKNIHPLNKKDVGDRLARWALADEYGKDIVKSGPLYKTHKVLGGTVIVTFSYIGKGLKSSDGKTLRRFEIKDQTGNWHWAHAVIKGDTVVISHPAVKRAVAARYAWAANPEGANLVNSEGLPASLYTTE